jgi:hypothetical protein
LYPLARLLHPNLILKIRRFKTSSAFSY